MIEDAKALEDFSENFEDLDDFYNSQFQTWQALTKALNDQFKANRPALEKDELAKKALDELQRIYGLAAPYDQLRHINPLIEQVQKVNSQLVLDKRQLAHEQVNLCVERVQSALTEAGAPPELQNKALHPLQLCKKRIDNTDSIPQLNSEQAEVESYVDDAYEQINLYIDSQRKKEPEKPPEPPVAKPGQDEVTVGKIAEPPVVPAPKRTVTISPANIANLGNSTFIETEAQVEQYLNRIRIELLKAVKAGDRVRIK